MKRIIYIILLTPYLLFGQDSNKQTIYASGMIDVNRGQLLMNAIVKIEGNKIISIETGKKKPSGDFIDLEGYTLLPGLIDCHTHLSGDFYLEYPEFDEYTLPVAAYGIMGAVNAEKTLRAGFTTVRDVHADFYSDVAIRDAINKGWIPGPRMLVTGPGLSITGGHGAWGNWLSPQIQFKNNPGSIADGEVEVLKVTREHLRLKVDWIKLFATGGFGSYGTIPGAASYSTEEMEVAVKEAAKLGIPVAAHAHGKEGILNALKAGVRSIEHATYLDQECIDLIKEKGAFLSMDLYAAYYDWFEKETVYEDKQLQGTNEEQYAAIEKRFKLAYDQNVPMVFSTDAGEYPHGLNARQFKLMVKAGMDEAGAIRSATITAAEMLGLEDQIGTLKEGKVADIIAVKGNPLANIELLEQVAFVMQGGEVIKNETYE